MKKAKIFSVAMATMFLVSCGGNKDKSAVNEQNFGAEEVATEPISDTAYSAENEDITVPEENVVEEVSDIAGHELDNIENFKKWDKVDEFKTKATSNNIDDMLDAYEWIQQTKLDIKERVRALEKDAISIAIELTNLNLEVAEQDEKSYTFDNMISEKQCSGEMSDAQKKRYWDIFKMFTRYIDMDKEKELYRQYSNMCNQIKMGF